MRVDKIYCCFKEKLNLQCNLINWEIYNGAKYQEYWPLYGHSLKINKIVRKCLLLCDGYPGTCCYFWGIIAVFHGYENPCIILMYRTLSDNMCGILVWWLELIVKSYNNILWDSMWEKEKMGVLVQEGSNRQNKNQYG